MSERPAVAVIGLGRMGSGIAHSILRSGLTVRVYNRTAHKAAPLVDAGAQLAETPADATRDAEIVISAMLDDASARPVVGSQDGLLAAMAAGAIHICTATISPPCASELAELHASHGQHFLAAPVLGRPHVAHAGQLTSLVGGPSDALERARACIEAYSTRIVHTGEAHATANSLKLAFNFYVAAIAELFGEFLTFTDKSGIDHEISMQTLRSLQDHPALALYLERVGARDFDNVGFEMSTGLKDLGLVLDAATAAGCPLPLTGLARDRTLTALATDLGDRDWAAFTEISRRSAGLHSPERAPTSANNLNNCQRSGGAGACFRGRRGETSARASLTRPRRIWRLAGPRGPRDSVVAVAMARCAAYRGVKAKCGPSRQGSPGAANRRGALLRAPLLSAQSSHLGPMTSSWLTLSARRRRAARARFFHRGSFASTERRDQALCALLLSGEAEARLAAGQPPWKGAA